MSAPHVIPAEVYAPRCPKERYRIYSVRDGHLTLLATTPDAGGIGVALVTLDEDAREAGGQLSDQGAIGVNDGLERRWIVDPFRHNHAGVNS